MPKSSSRTSPLSVKKNVRRFEIAVDDEVDMGVVHRLADLLEEDQALVEAEPPQVGGFDERPAVDVFEGEVGNAGGVDAAVEELCDAAMREAGEGLALDPEAAAELAALEPAADPLESDLAPESGLVALGEPDLAHAALAEQAFEAVGPDALRRGVGVVHDPFLERQRAAVGMRREHPVELARCSSGPSPAASPGSARRTWRSA